MNFFNYNLDWKKCLFIGLAVVLIGLPVAVGGAFLLAYKNRVYPQTQAAGISLSGLTPKEAEKKLEQKIHIPAVINLTYSKKTWELENEKLKLSYDFKKTAQLAFQQSAELPITNWLKKKDVDLIYTLDEKSLETEIATIAGEINQEGISPQIRYDRQTKTVEVNQGVQPKKVDIQASKKAIINQLKNGETSQPINLIVDSGNPLPSEHQLESAKQTAESLIDKTITLTSSDQNFVIEDEQLIGFVSFNNHWEKDKVLEYIGIIGESINREAKNAKFEFKEGQVGVFQPSEKGIEVNIQSTADEIIAGLDKITSTNASQTVDLVLIETEPEIKTADTNRLGIKTLIGSGDSTFRGSIASRVHNIDLASAKLNGVLINPGEIFSFNDAVGEISSKTGYQQAYVIKDGQTILGSGGGVCQVSTTMFRAALDAGLPIIERQPHAYRVSYYEQDTQPGFDATVYSPSPDLKFKNNTPAHILIQREYSKENSYLAFKFFGTSDGRKAIIENIRVWDVIPPPEPKYIDDPSLAPGETRRIESPSWGTKAAFDWKVIRNEEVIDEKTFFSHYRAWQAVYMRGVEN